MLLLALGGCNALPRDPEGTLARVEASRVIRVGLVDDAGVDGVAPARLIRALGQATGARARIVPGAQEPLFAALDQGRLDLVIGPFAKDSPWARHVALAPPIAAGGEGEERIELAAAARNGENRWIMLVERSSRAVAGPGASR